MNSTVHVVCVRLLRWQLVAAKEFRARLFPEYVQSTLKALEKFVKL